MATTCGIAVQTKIFFSELLQKQKKSQLYLITYFVSPQYLPFLINVEKLLLMHLYKKFICCINSFNNGPEHLQYDYFENATNFFQAISSKKLAALQFYSTHLNKSSLQKIIYYWPEGSVLQDLKNRTEHLAGQKGRGNMRNNNFYMQSNNRIFVSSFQKNYLYMQDQDLTKSILVLLVTVQTTKIRVSGFGRVVQKQV